MHLKHCSSDHNTSCDLEFDKNVLRLVTTGAINLKKKQPEGNTLLRFEYLFYTNTQVEMLESLNRFLIQKFSVSANILLEFFSAHCTCVKFFWDDGLAHEFFSYAYALAGYFFQNHPPPPPLPPPPPKKVKWLVPNGLLVVPVERVLCYQ